MRFSFIILAIPLSSCATSGDPSEGSLIHHGGAKFEMRAKDKQAEIVRLEGDTARLRAENDQLRQKIVALQNPL
jgi:hypothetical protein